MRTTLASGTPAALVVPAGDAVRGVVLVPDALGLRPLFDDMAERLAIEHGWAVCVPEPFPGREDTPLDKRVDLIATNDDDAFLADLVLAAAELATERTAVVGFCQGGMWAYKAAGVGVFDRAVAFYGMVRVPWLRPGHAHSLEFLERTGRVPVLSINGGVDKWTPAEDLASLRSLPDIDVVVYAEADHAFAHDPARPTYRKDDAEDAWARTVAFLT